MFMVVQKNSQLLMPSDVSTRVGFFDRFAGRAALFASRHKNAAAVAAPEWLGYACAFRWGLIATDAAPDIEIPIGSQILR